MAKGSKKSNGGKKNNNQYNLERIKRKPQIVDARKSMDINEIQDFSALSWELEEDNEVASFASVDLAASNMDRANFEAARSKVVDWWLVSALHFANLDLSR